MHVDSRLHCTDIATHSLLGGQHGEKSESEDEVSGKEDGSQDKAEDFSQEEVTEAAVDAIALRTIEGCIATVGEADVWRAYQRSSTATPA